ncbi:H-type small acid-soluble spore protein [Paramaledivibacter caminithermalis]|jgi:small acid-soluble spore protein H (minor)|uniref:Small acid-soluble spore protein H (Minor) n=1 Tax=Paramaledivibacter caminithermalis (strain DSM 15212 / CIP 107654 / DViRD3) TaxID=1121301 RepID=A0A1M6KA69_PARC5|nr:H-type small acid-soluble spore protein [Paramaledivibacter caminithermalis]SHJ55865.1 small acid-soluble spore protein H (minor) [Paramaledivibacter caminithermalis DSM 15212]
MMDINRAREILNSKDNIEVYYNGRSVWINSINPNTGNVFIKTLDGTNEHYQIPVGELIEE